MNVFSNTLFEHKKSAALGKSAPVDTVPVGFLVLATCPLVFWLLDGTVAGFASAVLVISLFSVGMLCLSIGHKNHLAYDSAEAARRPQIPLKLLGSAMVALVVGLLAATKIAMPAVPPVISCATFILCLVSFGLDPMRDKGLDDPAVRLRLANQKIFSTIEDRFDQLLSDISVLNDDDLNERTRISADAVLGLLSTVDFESRLMNRIVPTADKVIAKMELASTELIVSSEGGITAFNKRKYLKKMQTLADAFEARARKLGIGHGRNGFELQAELLFERMNRNKQR